jgi:hypothetical protein
MWYAVICKLGTCAFDSSTGIIPKTKQTVKIDISHEGDFYAIAFKAGSKLLKLAEENATKLNGTTICVFGEDNFNPKDINMNFHTDALKPFKTISEEWNEAQNIYYSQTNNKPGGYWYHPHEEGIIEMKNIRDQLIKLGNGIFSGFPERGWTFITIAEQIDMLNIRILGWERHIN